MNSRQLVAVGVALLMVLAGCQVSSVPESTPNETTTTRTVPYAEEDYNSPEHPKTKSELEDFDVSEVETRFQRLLNEYRAKHNRSRLSWSSKLSDVARYRSWHMATEGWFSHRAPDGDTFRDRLDEYGFVCPTYSGENIAFSVTEGSESYLPKQLLKQWKNSPDHNEAMLRDMYTHAGIGVYVKADGSVHATLILCT